MNYNITNHDITSYITQVINVIYNLGVMIIQQMRSIEFMGTNLFTFMTVIIILSIAVPILLVVPSKAMTSVSERIHKVRDYDLQSRKKEDQYTGYQKEKK